LHHIRLFAQVLVTYGRRVLSTKEVPDAYAYRYKGIWVCLSILTRALSGNYVNFGVFDLYGDPALKVLFVMPNPCAAGSCCHGHVRH